MRWVLVLLAACGDDAQVVHDAPPVMIDAAPACVAKLTGNVKATIGADTCATLGDTFELSFTDPAFVAPLAMSFAVTTAGDYTADTVAAWSVTTKTTIDHEDCLFVAGDQATPHGTFALHLEAGPHGTLTVDEAVRATTFAQCGTPLTEHLEVTF
ncbi:MAG: hypothetical protein QM831_07980 [Kofleriaceae bacterium]